VYGRIHEDVSTRLTPPSRKRTVVRGAHYIFSFDLLASSHGFPVAAASHTASSWRQWTLLRGVTMRSCCSYTRKGSSPNRVGNFWGFSLPSFVRRGRGGRGPRQPLRSLLEHPIQIRDHVSSLLSNPVRAFSMAAARSLPRALPHLAHAFAKALRRAGRSPYKGEG